MRFYDEDVQVRCVAGVGAEVAPVPEDRPEAFVWQGRLYLVREVLDTWVERRAWWCVEPGPVVRPALVGAAPATGRRRTPTAPGGLTAADLEERVWRVEAAPGRAFAPQVVDLGHCGERWRVLRRVD